jgi:hypothetical protein
MRSDLIYDIGAHRGEDSDYYLKRGFHVICVECDPVHVSFLKTRFEREIGDGRLTLIDRALASEEGKSSSTGIKSECLGNYTESLGRTKCGCWHDHRRNFL